MKLLNIAAMVATLALGMVVPSFAADKTLVVATNPTWPPFEFVDMEKKIVGYDIDIIKAVAAEAGFEVKVLNTAWDGIFATLDSSNCDIIASGVTITPERQKNYLFSEPYYNMRQALVVPTNSTITKIADIEGKRVGAQIGTTGVFALQRLAPKTTIATYDEVGLAFEDLKNGRIDAVMCDDPVAAFYANRKQGYENVMKVALVTEEGESMGFVFRKSDQELVDRVNKGLAAIRANGKEKEIKSKWLGE